MFLLKVLAVMAVLFVTNSFAAESDCTDITAANADNCLRLNHVQVLGSHNSYKRFPYEGLVTFLNGHRDGWSRDINYQHRPLTEQLEMLAIRQFELDVFADPQGGLYARPAGAVLSNDPELESYAAAMQEPGLKVLHSQDTDYRSTCVTFKSCLMEIRDWSLASPNHLPIMILVELKDAPRADWGPLTYTQPVPFDAGNVLGVDREIAEVFERHHLIMPDDVRKGLPSLEQAVLTLGWPTLAASRGKIMFALDNTGRHREDYLQGAPDLENRVLFISAEPGHASAGFIKMNDAMADADRIRSYIEAGYLIRTRSDIPMQEAVSGDITRRERALNSGAQYISTDFAEESPFGSGYQVVLPRPGRCNPVSAPAGCRDEYLQE